MKYKTCSQCKVEKSVSEFRKRKSRKDGYCSWCKPCHRAYEKKRYAAQLDIRKRATSRSQLRYNRTAAVNRPLMLKYLRSHPCVDCGETHPATLEFDHVRGTKKRGVTTMLTTYPWASVLKEIAKCVVRCANCHAKKTAKERGYYTADGFPDGVE